jgi:hypothetical protein
MLFTRVECAFHSDWRSTPHSGEVERSRGLKPPTAIETRVRIPLVLDEMLQLLMVSPGMVAPDSPA